MQFEFHRFRGAIIMESHDVSIQIYMAGGESGYTKKVQAGANKNISGLVRVRLTSQHFTVGPMRLPTCNE